MVSSIFPFDATSAFRNISNNHHFHNIISVSEKIFIIPKEAIIHFPAPISNVLNDVRTGHDGIMFFKSPSHHSKWLSQQGSLQGRTIPVETGYKLAKMWFSSHHDINWKLWKPSEVKEMFSLIGLSNDSFWFN